MGRLSSAGKNHPHNDDSTVVASNLSKNLKSRRPVAPRIATLPGDDPSCGAQKPSLASIDDDTEDGDTHKEGRDDIMIMSSINAIDVHRISWSPAADVQIEVKDAQVNSVCTQCDDDMDALRAQVDTGAHVSCADQLHMLHNCRDFTRSLPSPVKLLPATVGSDAVPKGMGYLHVPAKNPQGFLSVQTFCTPCLRTTAIDERDLVKASDVRVKDIESDSIAKHKDAGTFTYHAKHSVNSSKDVVIHGVLVDDKCYTGALIPPDLDPSDPKATPAASSVLVIDSDPEFAKQCRKATVLAIHGHQEAVEARLREEMTKLPTQFHSLPFHGHIQSNTPVSTIKAATERLLWHQRLSHPSDCCLFNAHQHADGVPRFPHMERVLDICPTCVRSKQTKNAAGGNTTRTAEQPYQGLSIDFSFSGTRSKNTFNRFPIGTKVKKKFGDKMFKGKVTRSPEDTTEQDPNAADFGETIQSWRVECEDKAQEDCNEREMEQIAYGNLPRFDPHKHCDDDYIGCNGETSWILVTDHFSRMKHGDTRVSKASPINWLRDFLEKHAPACSGKHVFMDQGGELYDNPKVCKLFT